MSSRRLKHFCELCRKQCKDQNGFKCHINSESHNLRVREYANNPLEHIERASKQFEGRFIQLIKTKYPGQPKYLEELYNELIEEKKFLKFNHTQWRNLGQFGQHLQGIRNIKVIGTPPNCKIVYNVHKTKDFIENANKEKALANRQRQKEQFEQSIASRIEKEKEQAEKREVQLNAKLAQLDKEQQNMVIPDKLELTIEGFGGEVKRSAFYTTEELEQQTKSEGVLNKKLDKIEKIYQQLKKKNEYEDEQQDEIEWVMEGITVRIKPHDIDPVFHNKKVQVTRVVEPYVVQVHLGTASIQIDQSYLQTVCPKPGHEVMILYGEEKGQIGTLKEANVQEGYGVIKVKEELFQVPFNLFSRFDPKKE